MNAVLTLVLGTVVLFVLLAVFFWPKHGHKTKHTAPGPNFNQEAAEEFAIPLPEPVKTKPALPPEMELPHAYGIDRLVLLVRDPHWLYAYWEISAAKQEDFNASFGFNAWENSRPVLRVYEISGDKFDGTNAAGYTDISLGEQEDNWHINVNSANSNYCVDLGRLFPGGRFVTILRSNIVTTPRDSLSDLLDEEWMWIEGIYKTFDKFHYGVSSPVLAEQMGRQVIPLGISSPGVGSHSIGSHKEKVK